MQPIRDITVQLSDTPIADMKDPHEQAICIGYVEGKKCVSLMLDGKPVFSFNDGETQASVALRMVEWMATMPQAAQAGWVKLMMQAKHEVGKK